MIVLSNWLLFPVCWIQLPKLCDISIQIQHKTAIQLSIQCLSHLVWPVSSSLWRCPLSKIEKRCSSFFWIVLWSADRWATLNMVLSTQVFIETLQLDDMQLVYKQFSFLTWVFRMECRAKIRKPYRINIPFYNI